MEHDAPMCASNGPVDAAPSGGLRPI